MISIAKNMTQVLFFFLLLQLVGCKDTVNVTKKNESHVNYKIKIKRDTGKGVVVVKNPVKLFSHEMDVAVSYDGSDYAIKILDIRLKYPSLNHSSVFDTKQDKTIVSNVNISGINFTVFSNNYKKVVDKLRLVKGKSIVISKSKNGEWFVNSDQIPWDDLDLNIVHNPKKALQSLFEKELMIDIVTNIFEYPLGEFELKKEIVIQDNDAKLSFKYTKSNYAAGDNVLNLVRELPNKSVKVSSQYNLNNGSIVNGKLKTWKKTKAAFYMFDITNTHVRITPLGS